MQGSVTEGGGRGFGIQTLPPETSPPSLLSFFLSILRYKGEGLGSILAPVNFDITHFILVGFISNSGETM